MAPFNPPQKPAGSELLAKAANVKLLVFDVDGVLTDGAIVYTSKLSSLKRFKDDASEVRTGFECGAGIANFNDVKIGDILECFQVTKLSAAEAAAQSGAPASRK